MVRLYTKRMESRKPANWPRGFTVLEVGTGATNGSCYELAAQGAERAISLEPFVALNSAADAEQMALSGMRREELAARVQRLTSIAELPDASVDCILSNSVLEHVTDLDTLFAQLTRVLRPGGFMLHIVDYRDHFFRYPYHFLIWSKKTWDRWLNPGDLPRWRITDHIEAIERCGLTPDVLLAKPTPGWDAVKSRIHPDFASYPEDALTTAFGVLWAAKK